MKLSMCTANLGPNDPESSISRAAELGFDAVELTVALHAPISGPAERRAQVRAWLVSAGIPCSAVHFIFEPGVRLASANPAEMQRATDFINRVVDLCADIDGKTVIVGGGGIRSIAPEQDRKQVISCMSEVIAKSAEYAFPSGITLSMEALNRYETNFLHTLESAAAFAASTGMPNVKTMGDTFHMNIEERSLTDAILKYGHTLGNVHLADSNRLAPGSGHIDFKAVVQALDVVGFDAYCSFEVFAIAPGQLYLESRKAADEEMERGIRYMRGLTACV